MTKKGILDGYKTYDQTTGHGNSTEWQQCFNYRMGFEEAEEIISEQEETPESILGINTPDWSFYTYEALYERYRKLIFEHHPDRGGDEEKAKSIIASFTYLKQRFGK